jgi:hypothetical protein
MEVKRGERFKPLDLHLGFSGLKFGINYIKFIIDGLNVNGCIINEFD